MNCIYCDGDKDGAFKFLPKCGGIGRYCATVDKTCRKPVIKFVSMHEVYCYEILYCPMCGKSLLSK